MRKNFFKNDMTKLFGKKKKGKILLCKTMHKKALMKRRTLTTTVVNVFVDFRLGFELTHTSCKVTVGGASK